MSSTQSSGHPDLTAALAKSMHDHWRLYLTEGIILVILGLAAIFIPPLAGIATTILLGWLFLIAGIAGLVTTFGARQAPGFWWSLLSALVALIAGGVLLWNPLQGVITLTYVLIAYLIVRRLVDDRPRHQPSSAAFRPMGVAGRQWAPRSAIGRHHHFGLAGRIPVGAGSYCRHRPRVRRRHAHRNGIGGAPAGKSLDRRMLTISA